MGEAWEKGRGNVGETNWEGQELIWEGFENTLSPFCGSSEHGCR